MSRLPAPQRAEGRPSRDEKRRSRDIGGGGAAARVAGRGGDPSRPVCRSVCRGPRRWFLVGKVIYERQLPERKRILC